mgnify:CR=1 FL=1
MPPTGTRRKPAVNVLASSRRIRARAMRRVERVNTIHIHMYQVECTSSTTKYEILYT